MAAVSPVRRILSELTRLEGVRGALVVSRDGFVIDAVIPGGGVNQEAVAALITGIMENVKKFGDEFNLGESTTITVEYGNGIVLIENLGDAYAVVLAEPGATVGRIRYELLKQKDRIKAAL